MAKGKVFRSTPRRAALMQPYIAPAHPGGRGGLPLGIDMRTHELLCVDVHRLRRDRIINGLVTRIEGLREAGKSTFMKALAFRMAGAQAGLDEYNYPLPQRIRIADLKPEDGDPEYGRLTEELESKVIRPVEAGKINPLDATMSDEITMLEISINLAETVLGRPLRRYEPLVQQIAVSKMYAEYGVDSCPEVLELLFRGLDETDIHYYYGVSNQRLLAKFAESLKERPVLQDQLQLLLQRPHNVPLNDFRADAAQMATAVGQLIYGDYGGIFGKGASMRSMLSQPIATIDRTGMNLKARNIFEALLWRWQTWALEHNDQELIPHINIGDEEADSYKSLMYLRAYDEFQRKARAFHTWDMKAVQVGAQLAKSGAPGSEIRELATSIERGITLRVIGKQPYDDEVLEGLVDQGFSELDAMQCTRLPTGCMALKVGDTPPVFMQFLITNRERSLAQTNAANRRMMQRASAYSFEQIRRRSELIDAKAKEGRPDDAS